MCLYGMLRVCMECYVFVWIVTCLYGMLRVCMECYVLVWNVTCYILYSCYVCEIVCML